MEIVIIFLIFILCFFHRAIYRIVYPDYIGLDTHFHLYYSKVIRDNKFKIPQTLPRFIGRGIENYPYFYHILLALFPKKLLDKYVERFLNPFLDALFAVAIYLFVMYLSDDVRKSLIASSLYIFTPIFFSIQSTGPRIRSSTPRLFGELLTNFVFIFLFLYMLKGSLFYIVLSALFTSLVTLSSRFSLQAIIFFSLIMFLGTFHFAFIFNTLLAIPFSLLISKGRYYFVLKSQINYLALYFRINRENKIYISKRNSIKAIIDSIKRKQVFDFLKQIIIVNSFTSVVFKFPIMFISLYYVIKALLNKMAILEYHEFVIYLLILSGLLLFILTNIRLLLFLGEAERYLIHIAFFIILIAANNISLSITFLLVGWGIFFQVGDFIYLYLLSDRKKGFIARKEFIDFLKSLPNKKNLLTIPIHLGGHTILYETSHNWFYPFFMDTKSKEFSHIMIRYPIINLEKLDYMADKYGIDYVCVRKEVLQEIFPNFHASAQWQTSQKKNLKIVLFERKK